MRILLTGAAGFIGRHIHSALSPDHEVIGLDALLDSAHGPIDAMDGINGRTKSMVELLSNLGITGSALVVTKDTVQAVVRAAHNIEKIWTLPVNQLNAQELLSRDKLVITLEAARWAEQDLAVPPPRWKDRMADPSSAGENSPEEASPVATVAEEPASGPAEEAAAESVDEAEDAGGEE